VKIVFKGQKNIEFSNSQ